MLSWLRIILSLLYSTRTRTVRVRTVCRCRNNFYFFLFFLTFPAGPGPIPFLCPPLSNPKKKKKSGKGEKKKGSKILNPDILYAFFFLPCRRLPCLFFFPPPLFSLFSFYPFLLLLPSYCTYSTVIYPESFVSFLFLYLSFLFLISFNPMMW